jgi:hypothetical protein
VKLAAGRRAWRRWLAAAGPWQDWSVCPALLSPEVESLALPRARRDLTAARLAQAMQPLLEPGGVLCVLDLEPTRGVQVAALLSQSAHPVLLLPRWPYAAALLSCQDLLATLLALAPAMPRTDHLANVVFVLDAERGTPIPNRSRADRRADNRHTLSPFDLPDLKTLRARGITRVHRITNA